MANSEHVKILKQGVGAWSKRRDKHADKIPTYRLEARLHKK